MKTTAMVGGVWLKGAIVALAFHGAGCGDDSPATTPDTSVADVADDTAAEDTSVADVAPDVPVTLCEFVEPTCSDEQIAALAFSDERSGGAIAEEGTTPGEFVSHIDATAGGFQGTLGYTYARFTDTGLVPVDLSDEESLESMDWDIAFRRYIARLNSGVSGPSCVEGGRTVPGTTFEGLTSVPGGVILRTERYFTGESCEFVPETSGIGSPLTVLSSYWNYTGCVTMSDNIYVVKLRSGRHVKLQFLSYYTPSVQDTCNTTDAAPAPNGSGNIRLRWAFID